MDEIMQSFIDIRNQCNPHLYAIIENSKTSPIAARLINALSSSEYTQPFLAELEAAASNYFKDKDNG